MAWTEASATSVCSDVLNLWQKRCSIRRETTDVYCVGTTENPPNIHSSLSFCWTPYHIKLTNNSNEKHEITSLQAWLAVD